MYYSYQKDDQNRSRDHVSWRYGLIILASSTDFSHLRSVACAQPAKSTPTRWLQHYASCREHGPLERKHTNPTEHPHYNPIENTHHTPSNPQSQPINGTGRLGGKQKKKERYNNKTELNNTISHAPLFPERPSIPTRETISQSERRIPPDDARQHLPKPLFFTPGARSSASFVLSLALPRLSRACASATNGSPVTQTKPRGGSSWGELRRRRVVALHAINAFFSFATIRCFSCYILCSLTLTSLVNAVMGGHLSARDAG